VCVQAGVVELLMVNGVDPNVKTDAGETALGMPATCLCCMPVR